MRPTGAPLTISGVGKATGSGLRPARKRDDLIRLLWLSAQPITFRLRDAESTSRDNIHALFSIRRSQFAHNSPDESEPLTDSWYFRASHRAVSMFPPFV